MRRRWVTESSSVFALLLLRRRHPRLKLGWWSGGKVSAAAGESPWYIVWGPIVREDGRRKNPFWSTCSSYRSGCHGQVHPKNIDRRIAPLVYGTMLTCINRNQYSCVDSIPSFFCEPAVSEMLPGLTMEADKHSKNKLEASSAIAIASDRLP